jgi:hypothetical protein
METQAWREDSCVKTEEEIAMLQPHTKEHLGPRSWKRQRRIFSRACGRGRPIVTLGLDFSL